MSRPQCNQCGTYDIPIGEDFCSDECESVYGELLERHLAEDSSDE